MSMRTHWIPVLALSLVALVPSAAGAQQTYITPYVGSSFNSTFDDYDFGTKLHYGGAVTFLSGGGFGFEVDFGYSPTFFEPGEDEFFDLESEGSVTTLMGNLVLGGGGGGVKPYVSGGFGLMRSRIETWTSCSSSPTTGSGSTPAAACASAPRALASRATSATSGSSAISHLPGLRAGRLLLLARHGRRVVRLLRHEGHEGSKARGPARRFVPIFVAFVSSPAV